MQSHFHYLLLDDLSFEDDLDEDDPEDDFDSLRVDELLPLDADDPEDLDGVVLL
jgi:hypothetical protein